MLAITGKIGFNRSSYASGFVFFSFAARIFSKNHKCSEGEIETTKCSIFVRTLSYARV